MGIARVYGRIKDAKDDRDLYSLLPPVRAADRPAVFALRTAANGFPGQPPIFNQLQQGSCTGNGWSRILEYQMAVEKFKPCFRPSRAFIYTNERIIEGTLGEDSGAQIRDGAKAVSQWGVCSEVLLPYGEAILTTKPSAACYASALLHRAIKYGRVVQVQAAIESSLVQGQPIVFGCEVFPDFEGDEVTGTGIVPMPKLTDSSVGGHCMTIVGYDRNVALIEVANSWGPEWGDEGYCWLPLAYVLNTGITSDLWNVQLVS